MAFTPISQVSPTSSFKPLNQLTPDQSSAALGHSTGLLGTVLSTGGAIVGGIGGAALGTLGGAAAGIETGPGAIVTGGIGGYLGGVTGSGAGAAMGEALAEKLQGQQLQGGEIAKTGGMAAGAEAVLGPLGSMIAKPLSKVASPVISGIGKGIGYLGEKLGAKPVAEAVTEKVAQRPITIATKRLASTGEIMTKAEREAAIKEGRMTPSGKFTPSATEQRAGEIMKGKTYSNPVKTVKALQDEIATRGQEAETYLEKSATPISNKEDFDAFQSARTSSEKYMTPSEANAYDEQIGVFQKILKGYGPYNTANYYKALKEYESQVTANLPKGKDALLTPGGSARIQAAKDVRTVVRNMIGEKNPEFKGKMYDLASLYDSLDNVVASAEKGGHSLAKRYPKTATAIGTATTFLGAEEIKKQLGI